MARSVSHDLAFRKALRHSRRTPPLPAVCPSRMNPFAEIYNRPDIARHYLTSLLQPAEAGLVQAAAARAGELDMLDLGVGAGRTSFFFLPFVRSYLGLDIAPRMIDLCRERYADHPSRGATASETQPP